MVEEVLAEDAKVGVALVEQIIYVREQLQLLQTTPQTSSTLHSAMVAFYIAIHLTGKF